MLFAHAVADRWAFVQRAEVSGKGDLLFHSDMPLVSEAKNQVLLPCLLDGVELMRVQGFAEVDARNLCAQCLLGRYHLQGVNGLGSLHPDFLSVLLKSSVGALYL